MIFNDFSKNIWACIERFKQPVWVVKKINNTTCTCVDHTTKQASNSCKICLGLGSKIKIYKTFAVVREGKEQETVFSESTLTNTPKMIYFKFGTALIEKDDYVVDTEDIYSVLSRQYLKGEDGQANTIKCVCPPLKMDSKIILKNFKEVLSKNGYKI
jgi:hypothetical protein